MGFEAFSIVLEASESLQTLRQFFEQKQLVSVQHESDAQLYCRFEYATDKFIIEVRVSTQGAVSSQTRIEFALCNGEGVDECYEQLISEYVQLFPSEAWFLTSAEKGLAVGRGDVTGLLDAIRRELPILRHAWEEAFGKKRGPVRIAEAYRFVGVV